MPNLQVRLESLPYSALTDSGHKRDFHLPKPEVITSLPPAS